MFDTSRCRKIIFQGWKLRLSLEKLYPIRFSKSLSKTIHSHKLARLQSMFLRSREHQYKSVRIGLGPTIKAKFTILSMVMPKLVSNGIHGPEMIPIMMDGRMSLISALVTMMRLMWTMMVYPMHVINSSTTMEIQLQTGKTIAPQFPI